MDVFNNVCFPIRRQDLSNNIAPEDVPDIARKVKDIFNYVGLGEEFFTLVTERPLLKVLYLEIIEFLIDGIQIIITLA